MGFQFTNTLTKQLENFRPIDEENKVVHIYSCGPTVYNYAHIGNLRSFIFSDILGRSLRLSGYKTNHAINLTDIDDKTINATLEKNANATLDDLRAHTQPFIDAFFEDLEDLGIAKVDHYPVATESIEPMQSLVKILIEKGIAYEQDGSVYFSIGSKKDYGKLSQIDLDSVKSGLRYNSDEYTKQDIRDFVLWKGEAETEGIAWNTNFGRGRPGWHLECSAMINHVFNQTIDIHTGGIDLVFPHHENEIAQSECAYGHSFVNYWLHCEHLLVDSKKMSKRDGNFYTLRDLKEKGFHPKALRYLLYSSHYRQKLNFTLNGLNQIQQTLYRIWNSYNRLKSAKTDGEFDIEKLKLNLDKIKNDFLEALQADLNVAKALASFHELISFMNQTLDKTQDRLSTQALELFEEALQYCDTVLNLLENSEETNVTTTSNEVESLLVKRNEARAQKDFALADELRDQIAALGYQTVDTSSGSELKAL